MNKNITVAVGLSGGIDSSMAAYLLKQQGYNVIGLTMKIWDSAIEIQEGLKHACYGPGESEDIEEAAALCRELDIPYHVIDLCREYKDVVLEDFRSEYLAGRTPNPCVLCNYKMKFGFLIDYARRSGIHFDYFATGHYAKITRDSEGLFLSKASDLSKDQTYFLSGLKREMLPRLMFPLGELTKEEVRNMARSFGLKTAEKAESQDFIAGGDYSPLFQDEEVKPGSIVLTDGRVLGTHKGIIHYTIGQRKGLGVSHPVPLYVMKIDAERNEVVVTEKQGLFSEGFFMNDLNLLGTDSIDRIGNFKVRIRQKHSEVPAALSVDREKMKVTFVLPQLSVSPGQTAVFYDGDIVIAAGIIESSF